MDVIKSTLPPKNNNELAADLLARFPGVDSNVILLELISTAFYNMRYGNKREERAACDLLNEVQFVANKIMKRNTPNA
jgi:hypothetical protein